jgi:mRNA-degrading endonuclease YafQ of YafQ-DinJ toxin-antitoxin module
MNRRSSRIEEISKGPIAKADKVRIEDRPSFTQAEGEESLRCRLALVRSTLATLVRDPYTPSLRLHPLKGRMQRLHSVRLSYADRIVVTLVIRQRQVVLLNIGTHNGVYR